jgi:hypothetical protein
LAFEALRKNIRYCDVKTKKEKRQASINKNELFCSMVEQAVKNGVLFDYVLADNWFGSNENIRFLHEDMEKKLLWPSSLIDSLLVKKKEKRVSTKI